MRHPTRRRLLAALAALLVICSVGGMPVVAAAAGDTGLSDGEVTTDVDASDETDREADSGATYDDGDNDNGTDGDGDEETTDGDDQADGDTDDGESDASDGESDDEGTDASEDDSSKDDGETGDDEAGGDGSDGDGSHGVADGDSDEDNDASSDDGFHAYDDRAGEDAGAADDGSGAPLKEVGSPASDAGGTTEPDVESLGTGTEEVVDSGTTKIDRARETVDPRSLAISIGALELELVTYEGATVGATGVEADDAIDTVDAPPELAAAAGTARDPTDHEGAAPVGAGDGDGGEPLPQTPGGAVVALGALAAVAAVRNTPFVATQGAKAASSGGSSLLSTLLEKARPFVFPLRYSRYDDSDPLEHEAREQVYEIVNDEPGSYLSEVSEQADLPLSTTRHHIKVLEREELVSGAKLRGKRRFYPAYAEGIELAAALNDDSTATILDAISRFGAASVSDLAEELERDPSTISHHLQRLEEDDIVTREREGRAVVTRLSSEARTALEPESTPRPGEAGEVLAGGAD